MQFYLTVIFSNTEKSRQRTRYSGR